jgi:hypothetical protein
MLKRSSCAAAVVAILALSLPRVGAAQQCVIRDASCPPAIEVDFSEVPDELPYGLPPNESLDTMYGVKGFVIPNVVGDIFPDSTPPWESDPDFYCADICDVGESGEWHPKNRCPNMADESIQDEVANGADWFATDTWNCNYNCLAWAVGRTDAWIWEACEGPSAGVFVPVTQLQQHLERYGYVPSAHCFPECGVRKLVGLGVWDTATQQILSPHVAVEVGDRSEESPEEGGWWESKFGDGYRVLHRFWDIAGGCFDYGGVFGCWERDEPGANAALCEPGYDPFADPANEVPVEICERWGTENYLFCRDEFCAAWGQGACPAEDADADGIAYPLDSCPHFANTGTDTDGDGIDDVCDDCLASIDSGQQNCDAQWDEGEPADRQGDACDPDPCTAWHYDAAGSALSPSIEEAGPGQLVEGELAYVSFDTVGFAGDGSEDETVQDVQGRYCSCAGAGDCEEACNTVGQLDTNPFLGTGWFPLNRVEDSERTREALADVLFVKGGPGGASITWDWQEEDCPGDGRRIDCAELSHQRFRLWLRPLVDPASWPDGWPSGRHNYYTDGEEELRVAVLPAPQQEPEWPGPRLVPEGNCFACGVQFFDASAFAFIGEFDPEFPLPDESPFRFAGGGAEDPVQGIGLGLIDPRTLAVTAFLPTRGASALDEPRVTGAALAIVSGSLDGLPSDVPLPPGGQPDASIWLFGGIDASGLPTSALYRGDTVQAGSPLDRGLEWHREYSSGPVPEGRVGTVLAHDRIGGTLVLLGGAGADGVLADDLWRFDLGTHEWRRTGLRGSPLAPGLGRRAFMAHAQLDEVVYLYGGRGPDGSPREDLWALDLSNGSLRSLEQDRAGPTPGPRAGAAFAVDGGAAALLLFGGEGVAGSTNDLWRYDLRTTRWQRLASPCSAGPCPPARDAAMLGTGRPGAATVLTRIGDERVPQALWYFDALRAGRPGWTSYTEWTRSARASDCDGDGSRDPEVGLACATSSDWFAEPAARACDSRGALAVCPETSPTLLAVHELSVAPTASFAVRGSTILVADGHELERWRLRPGDEPESLDAERLEGRPSAVAFDGGLALVATTRGVEVFSLAGGRLTSLARRVVDGHIGAMASDGHRLYVAAGRRLLVLDGATPELSELASVELPNAGSEAIGVAGTRVVLASGAELFVVSAADPSSPTVASRLLLHGATDSLRGRGSTIYGLERSGDPYVADVSDPSAPALVGDHDVAEWVRGASFVPGFAVRRAGRTLEIAEIAR